MIILTMILALVILTSAIAAITTHNLVRATIALGAGSATLAILFFMLNRPYAGGFELSVGAGLLSVLLIIGISLTRSMEKEEKENEDEP
jgi:NADH:ubiquinone oxidoreductase subunit 6 (subunit J)